MRVLVTYFFSSGPLDDSASHVEIPPVKSVRKLIARTGARGHATFGGCLSPDASGFPARAMAKTRAGDWRDAAQVRQWAKSVAAQLQVRGDWHDGLTGVVVEAADDRHVRIGAGDGADPGQVLQAAQAAGPVVRFSFEPPSLAEMFQEAIAR